MKLKITIIFICISFIGRAALKIPCAKIIFNSGRVIEAEILEMDSTEIRYKKCGQTTDVNYFVSKESVLVIKNAQDEVIFIRKSADYNLNTPESQKRYEPNSIWALIFAPISPLIAAIFSAISAKRMRDAPYKYKQNSIKLVKWATGISILIAILLAVVFAIRFQ
jgi:hypothetical protein